MAKKKQNVNIEITRFNPHFDTGLTSLEVEDRINQGLVNNIKI